MTRKRCFPGSFFRKRVIRQVFNHIITCKNSKNITCKITIETKTRRGKSEWNSGYDRAKFPEIVNISRHFTRKFPGETKLDRRETSEIYLHRNCRTEPDKNGEILRHRNRAKSTEIVYISFEFFRTSMYSGALIKRSMKQGGRRTVIFRETDSVFLSVPYHLVILPNTHLSNLFWLISKSRCMN